ncbi:shikimate dehydrogenase [Pontibacillus salicampi]|uniref:Shikimate dehydrogenase (NADP(+)) n=1 Tax=Pontibacillus salicampi TaxID=1449801 RepID=A0ABV6LJH4_9BACI
MNYLFGLIGYPAKHSKSPWIHQHFLDQQSLHGAYQIWETSPEGLKDTLSSMKKLAVDGFNVTVPYKEKVMDYLDEIDPYAEKVGAVNTVLLRDGKWIGYNTDGRGFVRSLQETYPHTRLSEKKALLIGAGGAARGIYAALLEENMQRVDIANRTKERAEALLPLNTSSASSSALSFQEAEDNLAKYDIVIQTTSVGMTPNDTAKPFALNHVKDGAIVADIIYKPFETVLLQEAREKGANILHGHGMLVYQAALAFELWTGTHVEASQLLKEFEQQLKGD